MRRRRNEGSIILALGGNKKEAPKKTIRRRDKSPYQNHVENSVKNLVAKEEKPYEKPKNVPINNGGKNYTFTDIVEPIDLPITDKTNLRFKIVKSEEENIYRVDIRTMVLKNNEWGYTQKGINFELGYIEDVVMNLVTLADHMGVENI